MFGASVANVEDVRVPMLCDSVLSSPMVALDGELLAVDVVVKPFASEGYCKDLSFDVGGS